MPRGGNRPGAGAKKGSQQASTIEKERARGLLRDLVLARLEPMVAAQAASAEGCSQFVYRDDSGRFRVIDDPDELRACIAQGKALRVFTRLPSTPAFTDLMNRALDKPKEQEIEVKVSGELDLVARLVAARKRIAEEK